MPSPSQQQPGMQDREVAVHTGAALPPRPRSRQVSAGLAAKQPQGVASQVHEAQLRQLLACVDLQQALAASEARLQQVQQQMHSAVASIFGEQLPQALVLASLSCASKEQRTQQAGEQQAPREQLQSADGDPGPSASQPAPLLGTKRAPGSRPIQLTKRLQEHIQEQQQQREQQQERQQGAPSLPPLPPLPRAWDWWRPSSSSGPLAVCVHVDLVRQPLLNAHARLRLPLGSQQLLAAAGGAWHRPAGGHSGAQLWPVQLAAGCNPEAFGSCSLRQAWQQLVTVAGQGPRAVQLAAAGSSARQLSALGGSKKRPWQPKMAPQEPHWNQSAFASAASRVAASWQDAPALAPGPPEHASAQFAVLMLLHGAGCPTHLLWERWHAAHPAGSVALGIHMKAGVELGPALPGHAFIRRNLLSSRVHAVWGDVSLVLAQLAGLEELLRRCPRAQHIAIASGNDVPLQLIRPGLMMPGVSMFGAYQFGEEEEATLKEASVEQLLEDTDLTQAEAQVWADCLTFHHQWMVLSRQAAAGLVAIKRDIMLVGRVIHKACNSVRAGMAPDEFVLITALRAAGFVRSLTRVEVAPHMLYPPGCLLNSYPTLVLFPAAASPHPVTWSSMDTRTECQVEKAYTNKQLFCVLTLNDCLDIAVQRCALFFRKVHFTGAGAEQQSQALLAALVVMWAGRRKGSSAALAKPTTFGRLSQAQSLPDEQLDLLPPALHGSNQRTGSTNGASCCTSEQQADSGAAPPAGEGQRARKRPRRDPTVASLLVAVC